MRLFFFAFGKPCNDFFDSFVGMCPVAIQKAFAKQFCSAILMIIGSCRRIHINDFVIQAADHNSCTILIDNTFLKYAPNSIISSFLIQSPATQIHQNPPPHPQGTIRSEWIPRFLSHQATRFWRGCKTATLLFQGK